MPDEHDVIETGNLGDDLSAPIGLSSEPDEELHKRNIEFLVQAAPACRGLKNYEPGAELQFLGNGEPTVVYGGMSLYGEKGAQTYTDRQYEDFWKSPHRILLTPPDGLGLDEYSKKFIQRILRGAAEENVQIFKNIPNRRADHVVVWGVGLATHLERLLEDTNCHNMLLVEPNLEFLYHSTFVFDWEALFKKAKAQRCTLRILPSANVAAMVANVREMLIQRNVMTVEGTLLYTHYPNQFFTAATLKLREDIASFFLALGFTEDEFFMIRHTYMNLTKKDTAKLFQTQHKAIFNTPVFVVGGGPSKDAYYDVLRANQDKAIIISCGSALDTLLSEGIKPDFHFLLERGPGWHDVLKPTTDKYDTSEICLVASSTVDPRIQDMFGNAVFFYRPALSPYKMFGKPSKAVLMGCDPQVGNAGFTFALHCGFKNIYLFGLDLGSRDPKVHHSRNSAPMRGEVKHHELTKKLPATLGGVAYTTNHLLLVRDNIENMISCIKRNQTIYNCGDGIVIKGTIPKVPRKLSLTPLPTTKPQVVADLIDKFKRQPREEFKAIWDEYGLRAQATEIYEKIEKTFDENPNLLDDELFHKLHRLIVVDEKLDHIPPIAVYRGNIHMMMMAAWYYLVHANSSEDREKLGKRIAQGMKEGLHDMLVDTYDLIDELQAWTEGIETGASSN